MAFCSSCGAPLEGTEHFCQQCGTRVTAEIPPENVQENPAAKPEAEAEAMPPSEPEKPEVPLVPVYSESGKKKQKPKDDGVWEKPGKRPDRVLSTWNLVLSIFLMSLPIAGFVLQIVWACGATNSLNRRNLARAYLIFTCISLVLVILFMVIMLAFVGVMAERVGVSFAEEFSNAFEREFYEEFYDAYDAFGDHGQFHFSFEY